MDGDNMTANDIYLKNEQNRRFSATAQLTILMSDPNIFQVEIHQWGNPPIYKPTHILAKQDIIKSIINGNYYVTNVEMLFDFDYKKGGIL